MYEITRTRVHAHKERGIIMDDKISALVKNCDLSKPMFRARSSEVFDLGDEKVLKLYFDDVSKDNVDIELLNTVVAFETGATPMECFGKVEAGGRQGLVFKKLYGGSLTDMPMKNPLILFKAGKIIASLHTKVHSAHSDKLRDVREVALSTLDNGLFAFLSDDEMEKLKNYISALPEADNIIHLDFHTDNILCDGENYQVIDWMTACKGRPEAELAMMHFLFHDAELFPGSSKMKILFMSAIRVFIYNGFIKNYVKMNKGVTKDSHKPWDVVAYVLRLGIWDIESERELLQNKIRTEIKNIK